MAHTSNSSEILAFENESTGEPTEMSILKDNLLAQLDTVLADYNSLPSRNSPGRADAIHTFAYSALAVVERSTGETSTRSVQARDAASIVSHLSTDDPQSHYAQMTLVGLVRSVRHDVESGFLDRAQTLVRAELFADLLEQAEYLLAEGFKDPAAMLCGGVLETHLRNLCTRNGIGTRDTEGRPLKASRMNDELAKSKAYSALDHKEVSAWLAIRNSAAHGHFGDYDAVQVRIMAEGVLGFMARHEV